MTRRTRRLALAAALGAAAVSVALASGPVAWEDLTEADWLYALATRFSDVDGHRVHYPTPTAELVPLLEQRSEAAAKRHLADARLALGDRAGAVAALEAWATAEGPAAWSEAARWGAEQGDLALAFRAAAQALPGLPPAEQKELATSRVVWADAHPEAADPIALRAERARLLPQEAGFAEDWIRSLEKAGRIDEALAAVEASVALAAERRLLLRSDLAADHGDLARAFEILDGAVERAEWTVESKRAYAQRVEQARPAAPGAWRATLERGFDVPALVRLATYFQGKDRGDRAADLLRQIERRHDSTLDRRGWLTLARLHGEIDAVPEAFRARLGAAATASPAEQADDLAALARLALRAGARPLGWGAFNDEPYRWAARIDRTPGFWTGGVAFLLTGADWKDALERLESDSLAERTFATARALLAELEARAPAHAELPGLRAAVLSRHVERGEGREALALLPLVERSGAAPAIAEARKGALLAMRQVEAPLEDESRLWRARLRALAPDGSRPTTRARSYDSSPSGATGQAWSRELPAPPVERYGDVLYEALSRLESRDASHVACASLVLAEMDRLPDAESLWLELADRLEGWNLDEELGPRYERALERFDQPGWWARAARWYARRERGRDMERLASELASRFRAAAVFARAPVDDDVRLEVPEQPRVGARLRLVPWADWVRLKALERFPHSPAVFREARSRLLLRSSWAKQAATLDARRPQQVVVDDALLDERGWAVLFADEHRREEYLADATRRGLLSARLAQWEALPARSPVEELLLFEGHARLSQFEQAVKPAARLAALYPGDGALAGRVLSLHRSLSALDPAQAALAATLVARTAPALVEPAALWTELGELEQEAGRPDRAKDAWRHILDRSPRDPERIGELATVLWDYDHVDEALATIEAGRERLGRRGLLAFEAGVLREEKLDIDGAVREYLAAGLPDESECFCSAFENDQRSLRRLSQLLGRERVRGVLDRRIAGLAPGTKEDEETLVAFFPLATLRMPDADLDWTADDWIDAMDHPVDPLAREKRKDDRERWRAAMREGQGRIAAALLGRTRALVDAATRPGFLDAVERWTRPLLEAQPTRADEIELTAAVLGRRAALAATPEDRVTREIARASYLFANGRRAEADAAWQAVASRVATLPEGAPRMRAEAERAGYLERSQGAAAAAAEWERLAARYPWSLGILEDRLVFLARVERGHEARGVLEAVAGRAARGHREALYERLAREAIEAGDLAQAQRGADALLAGPDTDDARRLAAVQLSARLQLRRDPAVDLLALAKREEPRLAADSKPALYAQLARAAALESAWKPALGLWIEALNRRLDRGWLREACAAAEGGGEAQTQALVSFFDRQRARSPRDVRWAVAVRELKLYFGDVAGALDAARAAIAVRPERGTLWTEAADLLARLGRPREGADLLAEWAKPRPADEDAATRRAALLAAAGDADGALAVERAAVLAYAAAGEKGDETHQNELAERRGRAARRLLELGLPRQAWALLSPTGGTRLAASGLGAWGQAELALAAGKLLPLLRAQLGDSDARNAAASVLGDRGRPEQKEEVARWIAGEILPAGAAARPTRAAFDRVWPVAQTAGLEEAVRVELARRTLARTPGPWGATPPESFVSAVAAGLIGEPARYVAPSLDRLWAADLVGRRRAEELWQFLAPRWDALVAEVRSAAPVSAQAKRRAWTTWLDDRQALELWIEGAAADPARLATIAPLLGERRAWDRLWALGARQWDVAPLVAALPDDARAQWFRLWLKPSPLDADPAQRAHGEAVERASLALGRLVAGREGAAGEPVLLSLRGPRTVGAVLDDRATPDPELWGERPGPSWLVLEALARLRARDASAALVPAELGDRGGETARARLASRAAEATGDLPLALALVEEAGASTSADLARRLRLLRASGREAEAVAAFRAEVRRQQPQLADASYRALARVADDLGLPEPATLLDETAPVRGPFVAALCDTRGLAACRGLKPLGVADFRAALAARYQERARPLSTEETRFALEELWANEAGALPLAGMRRLGGLWPRAGAWLAALRPGERREAVAALDALPDDARLAALVGRAAEPSEDAQLLLLRARLLKGDDERARSAFLARLAQLEGGTGLSFVPVTATSSDELGSEEDAEAPEDGAAEAAADPFVAGVRAWVAPFREARKLALVAAPAREAVRRRTAQDPRNVSAWSLELELAATPAEGAATLANLERAWRMGDLEATALEPVVEAAAKLAPAEAERWLPRLATGPAFDSAAAHARLLARLGRKPEAAHWLTDMRARSAWTAVQEVRAFDLWRTLAPEAAAGKSGGPEAWVAARAFWTRPAGAIGADLAAHLLAHPLDLRAGRAALRTVGPLEATAAALATRALQQPAMDELGQPWLDAQLLRLRAARALLPAAPAAARVALGDVDAGLARELERRRMPSAEVRAATADIARVLSVGGNAASADVAVSALEDRDPAAARALRAELQRLRAPVAPPPPYRLASGRPEPWRPRDLDWPTLQAVLDAEGVR